MSMPRSNEDNAWIQFLSASDNSIIRDAGETLLALTGDSLSGDRPFIPLAQKSPKEWEPALLLAACLELSQNQDLVEVSRILFEWFSVTFESNLHE
jgi:hypothetical protein